MRQLAVLTIFFVAARAGSADERLVALSERVVPSVVHLGVKSDAGAATGSGFIVAGDMIVTNHHVVEGCRGVLVKFQGGAFAVASGVLHLDEARDIAIIKIDSRPELMKALPVSVALPKQGEDVAAFGNPQGLEFSVTRGIISAIRTSDSLNQPNQNKPRAGTWIQTDAAISPGSSGGPLVNYRGEVVGMNTFYREKGQNLNFGISCVDIQVAIAKARAAEVQAFAGAFAPPKSSNSSATPSTEADDSVIEALKRVRSVAFEQIRSALPRVTNQQLAQVEQGEIAGLFPATPAANVANGMIARIRGQATVIQILEDGILLMIDGVKFQVELSGEKGGELRAKMGDRVVQNVPIDGVFYIGKAQSYTTVAYATSYYIPLFPIQQLLVREDLAGVVRQERSERLRRGAEAAASEKARQEATIQSYISLVRKTLSDATGKSSVDVAVVELRDGVAVLVRLDDGRVIDMPIARLGESDRQWIQQNGVWVRLYGSLVRGHLLAAASENNYIQRKAAGNEGAPTREPISPAFAGRDEGGKAALLATYGGTAATEESLQIGLEWLAAQQNSRSGLWSLKGPYTDGGGYENVLAATSMALLALQGSGHTHKSGKYQRNVEKGADALVRLQEADGNFFREGGINHRLYSQAQATLAMCELYGMTKDLRYGQAAQRALDYAAKAQSRQGGWRYVPREDSDTSVTGWFIMALQSGLMAGLDVPNETLDAVSKYLDSATTDGSFYSYQAGGKPTIPMTAAALLGRQYLGWPQDDPRVRTGVDCLLRNLVNYKEQDVYYWFYATQVVHNLGGNRWDAWNKVMRQSVPKHQVRDGKERGSWEPTKDRWGNHGGRLYTTCLSSLILEAYYRYLPIYVLDKRP